MSVQVSQPRPGQQAHQRQVLQAGIPAIDGEQARLKPACRRLHHRPDVVVLGQPVVCFVVDAEVTGQVGIPISPQHPDQIDTHDDTLLVARPMVRDQLNRPAPRRVQRRVVDHQAARGHRHTRANLFPHGSAIHTTPVQQTRLEPVMYFSF